MTKCKKIILVSVFGFFLAGSFSLYHVFSLNSMPKVLSNEVIKQVEKPCVYHKQQHSLDNAGRLNIAVWNIYKQQKANWLPQLTQLVKQSNLVLLQEAKLSKRLLKYLSSSSVVYFMAEAFRMGMSSVGVMTISNSMSLKTCALLSAEPWIRFPKSTLVSEYALSNGEVLLVVNLHGINFDWRLIHYKEQFEALSDIFKQHKGPAILAGDFNTWRLERQIIVKTFAQNWGLIEANYNEDHRISVFNFPLDHLYYRGLTLIEASSFETQASDHSPIIATFKIKGT